MAQDYTYSGVKWGSQTLGTSGGVVTYYFAPTGYVGEDYTFELELSPDYQAVVVDAFEQWASYGDISFVLASDIASADIVIGFDDIDGSSGVLASTTWWYTFRGGIVYAEIAFDLSEDWALTSETTVGSQISFEAVALHEIGHAFGLDHYDAQPAIMNAYYGSALELTSHDINGIIAIYGSAGSVSNSPPVVSGTVELAAIAEDSGGRLITQAELLANASDPDGDPLTASALAIASGNGTLVDNHNGTWTYTPAPDDDTSVTFSYIVSDGAGGSVNAFAQLDITPVPELTGWYYGYFFEHGGRGWEYGWHHTSGWAFGWHYDYGDAGWSFGWTWNPQTGWELGWFYASGYEYGWHQTSGWAYGWHYDYAGWNWGAVVITVSSGGSIGSGGWYGGRFYDASGTGWEIGWYQYGGWAYGWHYDYGDAGWGFGWTWNPATGWELGWFYASGYEYGWYTTGAWAYGWHYDFAPWAWGSVAL